MSDSQPRIDKYRRRADESLALAERAADDTARKHYMRLAESYLQLIEMEVRRLEIRGKARRGTGTEPQGPRLDGE